MGEFQVVTNRKHKFKKKKYTKISSSEETENFELNEERLLKDIEDCRSQLLESSFWLSFVETVKGLLNEEKSDDAQFWFKEMVVYGIGKISTSVIARYQLALTVILKEKIEGQCYLYDPVLSSKENSLIENLGFAILEINEECKRKTDINTLYFMMHCGKAMYNNLLWKNWNHRSIQNVCVLGNSFRSYEERLTSKEFSQTAGYIQKILPYTSEKTIGNYFHYDDIFNDTALHVFPQKDIVNLPDAFWDDNAEPTVVDDTEIIRRK